MAHAVAGWHRGERTIQKKLGVDGPMRQAYTWIDAEMPEQHRKFHTTCLPFLPVTTLDESGRPWSSILAGPKGEIGFISSPSYSDLRMNIKTWDGDPFLKNVKGCGSRKVLLAGIGIELSTRRRNKLAGYITSFEPQGDTARVDVLVNQAIGNCPKYINVRDLEPHPSTSPSIIYENLRLGPADRLPDDLIALIHSSDTTFLGTSYDAPTDEVAFYPSHVGQNHRGGRPGFIRVRPSDGRTVVLPDYSGNRLMTSLGNIEATPLASLTFIDFKNGHILYLTGDARTLVGQEAHNLMPRQNVLTTVNINGYVYVRDAFPLRERPGSEVIRSPYSPPIRLLAEEISSGSVTFDKDISATLTSIKQHSQDLATFTWETSSPVHVLPGQTAVMDFTSLLGAQQYAHMAPLKPSSVNDDRIRTWTISSSHLSSEGTSQYSLTMREKPGGAVTGALFSITRKIASVRPELLSDARVLGLSVKLVGIAGDFYLERPLSETEDTKPSTVSMLWAAGGIGITPFLSMLSAITSSLSDHVQWDIVMVVSTREPDILLPLIVQALEGPGKPKLRLRIDAFSHDDFTTPALPSTNTFDVTYNKHSGRITRSYLSGISDVVKRTAYVCGPEGFERNVLDVLGELGIPSGQVKREGFAY